MTRTILGYGLISGAVVIGLMITGQVAGDGRGVMASEWFGYLIMLIALSLIFVAVKRYRDNELAGVIGFLPALGLGLGIAAVAGVVYVAAWEAYLASSDYAFIDDYVDSLIASHRAAGLSGEALQAEIDAAEAMRSSYSNPMIRLPMTFLEIFPVGLLVAVVSAALLRNPRVLPAQA